MPNPQSTPNNDDNDDNNNDNRDNLEFQRTCSFYYEDFTFQEAFERTRKHVCISVSASTLGVKNPVRGCAKPCMKPPPAPAPLTCLLTDAFLVLPAPDATLRKSFLLLQGGPRRLLLNHITTPHVLIRSAVAASCSLPGRRVTIKGRLPAPDAD